MMEKSPSFALPSRQATRGRKIRQSTALYRASTEQVCLLPTSMNDVNEKLNAAEMAFQVCCPCFGFLTMVTAVNLIMPNTSENPHPLAFQS